MNMSTLALHRSPQLVAKVKNLEKSKTNIDNNYSDINQRKKYEVSEPYQSTLKGSIV